ncbi:MAG TPA: ABC transporter permease [Streptosporangiaceae bacterium]|nr:ABC transporter permease [Streptosporangiaceae bacterium]
MPDNANTVTTEVAQADPARHAATARLPAPARLLVAQIGYQIRQMLANGRTLAIGIGLPVILLVASKGKGGTPDVAGYAAFGLTITAWASYGVRLVAARESGLLKRWRASPLPRWCYFAGAIVATTLTAVIAGAVAVVVALVLWGSHFDAGRSIQFTGRSAAALLIVFALAALAWASAVTAVTSIVPSVEAAFPTLTLIYFPLVIISGVLFSLNEPHWLSTLVSYLPAQPMIDAATNSVRHGPGVPFIPGRDAAVLAAWAAGGLLVAIVTFRWEPHRPRGHAGTRPARAARPDVG